MRETGGEGERDGSSPGDSRGLFRRALQPATIIKSLNALHSSAADPTLGLKSTMAGALTFPPVLDSLHKGNSEPFRPFQQEHPFDARPVRHVPHTGIDYPRGIPDAIFTLRRRSAPPGSTEYRMNRGSPEERRATPDCATGESLKGTLTAVACECRRSLQTKRRVCTAVRNLQSDQSNRSSRYLFAWTNAVAGSLPRAIHEIATERLGKPVSARVTAAPIVDSSRSCQSST